MMSEGNPVDRDPGSNSDWELQGALFEVDFSSDFEVGNFDLGFFSSESEAEADDIHCVEAQQKRQQPLHQSISPPSHAVNTSTTDDIVNDNSDNSDDDDDDYYTFAKEDLPSTTSRRPTFVAVGEDQTDFIRRMKNTNTVKKTESVIKIFKNWLQAGPNFETRSVERIPPVQLNNYVGSFLLSIRKHDGSEYEPDTLTSYQRGIDRWLKENNYPTSIVFGEEFKSSRDVLASKRKELKQKGKGNRPNKSTPLTTNEQDVLQEKGVIGCHSPRALQNLIWLNNTVHFGLRGRDENRKLKWGDISLHSDERGTEYLQFNERDTKTRNGEHAFGHQRPFQPKQFATGNKENCPVSTYKKFKMLRPTQMCNPDSPFYLSVNHNRKAGSNKWYKSQAMGKNFLNNMMKRMAERANLSGRKTNHSARATTATRLLHAGVPPTTIVQLTGHKNLASLNNYATASHQQQEQMSNILSNCNTTTTNNDQTHLKQIQECDTISINNSPPTAFPATSTVSVSDMRETPHSITPSYISSQSHSTSCSNRSNLTTTHTNTMAGVFHGATFNNCTFNLTFSSSSS